MKRRDFLFLSAASAVACWLADQREVRAATPGATLPPVSGGQYPASAFVIDQSATQTYQAKVFPQSVASGDPAADGIVLWTRVQPRGNGSALPANVGWQIAVTSSFTSPLIEGMAAVTATSDGTVRFFVQSSALQPFTQYYYRFIADGVVSRTGRFKTLPATTADLQDLKLGVVVCQDFNAGYYTAYSYLAAEPVDYIVFLGDYVYEYAAQDDAPAVRARPTLPSGGATPQSLADYRALYQTVRSDRNLQAAHEHFAWIQLWDDHEFYNDCHQDFHPDTLPAGATATTPFPDLRKAANQAWAEYSFSNVAFDPAQDWSQSIRIYRSFLFGKLAQLVVTDERLYRDGPPCGDQTAQRYATLGCANRTNPSRTMLGSTQRSWFLDEVTGSKATWKLWANEVMLMQLKLGTTFIDLDQWDGYPAERATLLSTIANAGVNNFVALTGDLHTFLAGELRTNFDNPLDPSVGVELMVGSISSSNFADQTASAANVDNAPIKIYGMKIDAIEPLVLASNPHIKYFNSSTHGYMVVEVTPQALNCTFKAVTTVSRPTAGLIDPLAKFQVPAGQARLTQLA